ncbi:hypothetical protein CPT06_02890 [Bacillus vallismortis]|nr:hypothetical protein CPT06_02890 [Bacillus vallismortis]
MSENKLLFFILSFSAILHSLNSILDPTASWTSWLVNIALFLLALLFLKYTLKEKKETQKTKPSDTTTQSPD